MKHSGQENIQRQKVDYWLPEAGWRNWGYKASFLKEEMLWMKMLWSDENVMELDSGDSCITL